MRPIQKPTRTAYSTGSTPQEGEYRESHPAYAQISACHQSGDSFLYGSDFKHQHTVAIRIHASERIRNLSNDWYNPAARPIIEVVLSESQWAAFVSHPNRGEGTPCTLRYLNGENVPGLPAPELQTEQFGREFRTRLERAVAAQRRAAELVAASGLSKAKQSEILSALNAAERDMGSNLEFVAGQFSEHMERVVTKAKTEVNAMANMALHNAGMRALAASGEGIGSLPALTLPEAGER